MPHLAGSLHLSMERTKGDLMKTLLPRVKQEGFTLIELMIVVGIIGILVAIAAPNFARYQSKARQSEAKIALAAIYGAEKGFFSEYAAYAGSMDAIGYTPEGQRRFYNVGWAAAHSGSVNGYGGVLTNGSWTSTLNPYSASCTTTQALATTLTGDALTFTVSAGGCLRNFTSGTWDHWNITDTKVLLNNVISL